MRQFKLAERAGVVAGEADHLASAVAGRGQEQVASRRAEAGRKVKRRAARTGQAGKPVLEDRDVIVGSGDLTGQPGRPWTQRALVGRRFVRAVLAQRRDDHPLAGLTVESQLRLLISAVGQWAPVGYRRRSVPRQREQQQLAAVRKRPPGRGLGHGCRITAAMVRRPTCSSMMPRSPTASPSSTIRLSTRRIRANTLVPTSRYFV